MAQKLYDQYYKIQAVKLANEICINKAAKEIGVAPSTVNGWAKASRKGILDLGIGSQSPDSALALTEELMVLKNKLKSKTRKLKD